MAQPAAIDQVRLLIARLNASAASGSRSNTVKSSVPPDRLRALWPVRTLSANPAHATHERPPHSFDHHANLPGQHAQRMAELDAGLQTLFTKLAE